MVSTVFLGKVLGLYLVIWSLVLFIKYKSMPALIDELLANRALILVLGLVMTIIGLLMVVSHNVWMLNGAGLITLMSWLILIKGLFYLFKPEALLSMKSVMLKKNVYFIVVTITFIIGLYLCYYAFGVA